MDAAGRSLGVLHGLPTAHKDLAATAGIRTTQGSPIFADAVPDADELMIERVRAAGCVTVGKTNTPEFGAGSHTFNAVFGATRNPWHPGRSAGGSSGGAAVALAAGMVPLADGSDLGGSLRNPASFNGVVGMRPTPGLVPTWPTTRGTRCPPRGHGPLRRRRSCCCSARWPARIRGRRSGPPVGRSVRSTTGPRAGYAWRGASMRAACRSSVSCARLSPAFRSASAHTAPSSSTRFPTWRVLPSSSGVPRVVGFERNLGELYDARPHDLKDTIRWNIELACSFTAVDVAHAVLR